MMTFADWPPRALGVAIDSSAPEIGGQRVPQGDQRFRHPWRSGVRGRGATWALMILVSLSACSHWRTAREKSSKAPEPKPDLAPYELVWSDEFDSGGVPDRRRWSFEAGFLRNDELQYYTDRSENARIEDGKLLIEGRKERYPYPKDGETHHAEYTSASLTTAGKQTWTYGRFEVSAKVPGGRGTWPAIWMLGENIHRVGWPHCGEIDIMENVGFDPHTVHFSVHTTKYVHTRGTQKTKHVQLPAPHENFHEYAIEWTPERIDFFVDDQTVFSYEKESDHPAVWPFDEPFYLIVNLAIGGGWGGERGIDEAAFPQRYYVDYVRVYQRR